MIDSFGRTIDYLRVSVTKRCNLCCSYCGAQNETAEGELTPDQLEKIVRAFAQCGITKVRLTGGEPLVRSDILEIAQRIAAIQGIRTLALTTNGVRLRELAQPLKNAGVSAINISLDTTDREQFACMTGHDSLDKVMEGLAECVRVGFSPVRVNAVLIRGQNDDRAESLIHLAKDNPVDVRFIELMPFSEAGENRELVVTGDEILARFPYLRRVPEEDSDTQKSAARYYEAEGFCGRVGLITPVSNKFCKNCNRIRLLSDGKIKPCLGHDEVFDCREILDNDGLLLQTIRQAILSKPTEHRFSCGFTQHRGLNRIGG